MEWLFFVTKPSFLSSLAWPEKLVVLGAANLLMILGGCFSTLGLIALGTALAIPLRARLAGVPLVVPAVLFSSAIFLALNNFTVTVLNFGIRDAQGALRILYVIFFAATVTYCLYRLSRAPSVTAHWLPSIWISTARIILLLSLAGGVVGHLNLFAQWGTPDAEKGAWLRGDPPNILWLESDCVNPRHLSLYGYVRRSSPYLEDLADEARVYQNAFANGAHSAGSIVSMLTGKLPTETRLILPPDVLLGQHRFESLSTLLRTHGYRTFQSTIRHYADAYDINPLEAFDAANARALREWKGAICRRSRIRPSGSAATQTYS